MTEQPIGAWLVGDDEAWQPPEAAEAEPGGEGRRGRLWLLALLPWLAVAVLGTVILAGTEDDGARQPPSPAATPSVAATAPIPATSAAEPPVLASGPSPPAQTGPVEFEDGEVPADIAAAATTAVRLRVTHGPTGAPRYVDQAAASSAAWLDDIAVVRVHAVVLDGDGQDWSAPALRRYGVAVVRGEHGAVAISEPWSLTPPPAGGTEGAGTPVEDPAVLAAVSEALARAGYEEVELQGVTRASVAEDLLVAAVVATAPEEQGPAAQLVWLHGAEPVHVLGTSTNEDEE